MGLACLKKARATRSDRPHLPPSVASRLACRPLASLFRVTAAKHCASTTIATLRGLLRHATADLAIHTVVPQKPHLSRFDPPKRPLPGRRQTACKPGSVPSPGKNAGNGDGHSSGTPVAERLVRPTRAAVRRFARLPDISGCLPLLLGLAPGGVFPAAAVAGSAVRSYRTFAPLPGMPGGLFSVALSLGSPPPGVTRHRTSVEPGLSSPRRKRRAAIRPSGS